jgi:SpoIID/LytB domain protein
MIVRRSASSARARSRCIGLVSALLVATLGVSVPVVPIASAGTILEFEGRGNGHGIGMSQWGAYGYAADHGWNATQILDHYYRGTVAGTTDDSSITVRLQLLDDRQTAVIHDRTAAVVDGIAGGPWRSVVARETAPGTYTVWARADGSVCPAATDPLDAGGWTQIGAALPSVTIRPSTDTSASTDMADLLAVCEPSGTVRSYRGTIRAVNGSSGENRTVNVVPLEQYLRSVVASEMSGGWGVRAMAALEAQAVAARSYGLATQRWTYAQTCDQVCQFYPGAARRAGASGAVTRIEHPSIDQAVAATAGRVRRVGTSAGPIANTMFSSSSGGWTATNTLGFGSVEDLGDSTSLNPHRSWTATVDSDVIETAWPSIGVFRSVTVLQRSGSGPYGGRVISIRVDGASGQVTLTGESFRRAVGMRSELFAVRGTPAPDPGPCAGRVAPPVGAAPRTSPSGFSPVGPVRLVDTRDGTGTARAPLGGGCTLVVRPDAALVGTDATAVAVNITSVDPAAGGFVSAWPCGVDRPFTAVLQPLPGQVVGGAAVVPMGADGSVCVFSSVTTDLVIDLTGAFGPSAAARYEPITTVRLFDSRPSARRLTAGETVRVGTVGGGRGATGSSAVAVTLHLLDATASGFVTAWPCDAPRPLASSANVDRGRSVTNVAMVPVSAAGEVCLYSSTSLHLAVDLDGWFGAAGSTTFRPVTPYRLIDTRNGTGWSGASARNVDRRIQVAGTGGLPATGVRAVVAQLTAVEPSAAGFVTVHPCLARVPQLSMLRFPARTNVAGLLDTSVSAAGQWCMTSSAATHLVVDVSGWFG